MQKTAKRIYLREAKFQDLEKLAHQELLETGLTPEYFVIRNSESLKSATTEDPNLIILVAARLGSVRLIDNIRISLADHEAIE